MSEVTDAIAAVAPAQDLVTRDVAIVDGTVQPSDPAGEVVVPADPGDSIVLSGGDATDVPALSIALPAEVEVESGVVSDDGTVVYESVDGGVDVAVQVMEDSSVRVMTVIPDANAPREYTYDLGLPADAVVTEGDDGSMLFTTPDGDFLGGVAAPWAKDANGVDIPTRYRVDGSSLVQEVDFTDETVFPVVADPWMGLKIFSSITRTSMGSWWKVSANKSLWGHNIHTPSAPSWAIMLTAGWDEIKAKYPHTVKPITFRQQYECHVAGGYLWIAGDWNLEGNRPARTTHWSYGVAKHHCNWSSPDRY
ncbi:hypothetical protein [Sanguibacter massiliensis]|uniref:hypothetical protein n=1 Tax=Sanguibacter massiliensis TaxID=1973217 RepID=UPI000C8605F1|nr:hypothetical protein [Sanguibacter massiliensis]